MSPMGGLLGQSQALVAPGDLRGFGYCFLISCPFFALPGTVSWLGIRTVPP